MPFYNIILPQGIANAEEMRVIAEQITHAHCSLTGAPKQFVHVIFSPYEGSAAYSGGKPSRATLVRANIRAGRSQDVKEELLSRLTGILACNLDIDPKWLMVTILETPGTNAMEGGVLLPDPKDDAEWYAAHGYAEET